ncbi:MAG TPA: hypothetical protein VK540_15960, partial [Polyangiaceae bacterium]|nr:hypothetical protein [Polyangiaceae bacterium]
MKAAASKKKTAPPSEVPTAPPLGDVVSFHLEAIDAALGNVKQYCPPVEKASTAELLLRALCGDPRDFAHDAFDDIAGELNVLSAAIGNDEEPLSNEAIQAAIFRIERRAEVASQVAFRIEQAHFKAD